MDRVTLEVVEMLHSTYEAQGVSDLKDLELAATGGGIADIIGV